MARVIPFRERIPARFGCCPKCGGATGLVNIGKSHWVYCRVHKTKWFVGCSLLGRDGEGPAEWMANSKMLELYQEVRPNRNPGDGRKIY